MAKAPAEIKSLARSHTASAVKTLAGIMNKGDAPAAARVQAAKELLDRGWGKSVQAISAEGGGPLVVQILRFDDDDKAS